MKKILFAVLSFASLSAMAQETYTNAELVTEDLNGTARYIGMGGAMEALGADISTISTNPAGIGMFRRSTVGLTGGVLSQQDAGSHQYGDATKTSFDQIGFVWSTRLPGRHYMNIAFNYKKNRNFNSVMSVAGNLAGASQNKNSYMNLMDAYSSNSGDWLNSSSVSQLDALYYWTFTGDQDGGLYYNDGKRFTHDYTTKGYVNEYDVNVSGNVSNRLYLGVTFGFNDLDYKSYSTYSEELLNSNNSQIGSITVDDYRNISGTGFNVKFGAIFFPIEGSPFRIGISVATPTWYDLDSYSYTTLNNNADTGGNPYNPNFGSEGTYSYRVYTPWKFGIALGHTIGQTIALGASYEYADYSNVSSRVIDDDFFSYGYYGSSYKDEVMNNHTQRTLKGVSTLKLGAEFKASKELAVRAGYNFVSSMYRGDGLRDGTLSSPGTYYSSRSDYTNWNATHRITLGAGYTFGKFAVDVAYQYNTTGGTYYPFMGSEATYTYSDGTSDSVSNYPDGVKINNKHHQLTATLSYRF